MAKKAARTAAPVKGKLATFTQEEISVPCDQLLMLLAAGSAYLDIVANPDGALVSTMSVDMLVGQDRVKASLLALHQRLKTVMADASKN